MRSSRSRPSADVLVSKYADHLLLFRQSQIFDREGFDLDRFTLADWVGKAGDLPRKFPQSDVESANLKEQTT